MQKDRDEWIRTRSYEIWHAEGRPHGHHDEHWWRAEQEHDAKARGIAATAADAAGVLEDAAERSHNNAASTGSTPQEAAEPRGEVEQKP